jgi:hypothetical protein
MHRSGQHAIGLGIRRSAGAQTLASELRELLATATREQVYDLTQRAYHQPA